MTYVYSKRVESQRLTSDVKFIKEKGNPFKNKTGIRPIWMAVFTFPYILAAKTFPLAAAMLLSPSIAKSLPMKRTGNRGKIWKCPAKSVLVARRMKAESTRNLSAKGSRNFPRFVTRFRLRAIWPSTASVIEPMIKMIQQRRSIQSNPK